MFECLTELMGLFQEFGKGHSVSRCDLKQNLLDGGCSEEALEFPSSTLTIQKEVPLSDKATGAAGDVTQLSPQKLRMVLRPGTQPDIIYNSGSQPGGSQPPWVLVGYPGALQKNGDF